MDIQELVQKPESLRDGAWEQDFFKGIVEAMVEVVKDRPEQGPDGWPYLLLKTANTMTPKAQSFIQVIQWAYTRGVGLAVNTHKMMPDYIFTYGMVWNFAETGRFVADSAAPAAGQVNLDPATQPIIGAPTEKYFPQYARKVIRDYLAAHGFADPKIVVISSRDYKTVDLAFSTESLGDLPESKHKAMAEGISWFLPLHYSLIFVSEQNLRGFVPL